MFLDPRGVLGPRISLCVPLLYYARRESFHLVSGQDDFWLLAAGVGSSGVIPAAQSPVLAFHPLAGEFQAHILNQPSVHQILACLPHPSRSL